MSEQQYWQISELFTQPESYGRDRAIGDLYNEIGGLQAYAIRSYNKALAATHDSDARWDLMHKIADLHFEIGEPRTAMGLLIMANSLAPDRPESLYKVVEHERNEHPAGCAGLLNALISIPENKRHYPGRVDSIHRYGIAQIALVVSFYCGISDVGQYLINILQRATDSNEQHITTSALTNYRFYMSPIKPRKHFDFSKTLALDNRYGDGQIVMRSSTPSIVKDDSGYIMNTRYVNYTLQDNGTFTGPDEGFVYNLNVATKLDADFQTQSVLFESHPSVTAATYDRGPQDVRLWRKNDGNLTFTCTTVRTDINVPWVAAGDYTEDGLQQATVIDHSLNDNRRCEKNWVFVTDDTLVYSWSPLVIGRTSAAHTQLTHYTTIDSMNYFKLFRGGTHAQSFGDNELLFVTHAVIHVPHRVYFHFFVTLDARSLIPMRCSYPFTFSGSNVEYCAGLLVDGNDVIITYSIHDSTTHLAVFDKSYIDGLLWKV